MTNNEMFRMIGESCNVKAPDRFSALNFEAAEQYKNTTPKISAKRNYITAAVIYAAACIALLVAIPFIIGGGDMDEPIPAVSGDETTTGETEYDLGGKEFVFLTSTNEYLDSNSLLMQSNFYDESDNYISKAVSERNKNVEDEFGIKLKSEYISNASGEAVFRAQSGQTDFDALIDDGNYLSETALEGYLYDLRAIDTVDLSKSYWLPGVADSLSVADRQFFTSSKLTLDPIHYADFIVFNGDVVTSHGFSSPYDLIDQGEWTYDTLIEMNIAAEKDVDGDGKIESYEDHHGGLSGKDLLMKIWQRPHCDRNSDDTYTYVPYTDKIVESYNKYKSKLDGINYALEGYKDDLTIDELVAGNLVFRMFDADQAMFIPKGYIQWESTLAEMLSANCGAVPYPALTEDGSYYTEIEPYAPMLSIPSGVADPEMTGRILDYMACESEKTLYADYLEKCTGDSDTSKRSAEMLDMILDSAVCDWAEYHISEYSDIREKIIMPGSFSSVAKRFLPKIQETIDDTVQQIKNVSYGMVSTDEEDVVFGSTSKPIIMYDFTGNLEKDADAMEFAANYLYGLTKEGEIYTLRQLNAVLKSDANRLLAISFVGFDDETGALISVKELREALVGDKKYTKPEFARSEDYDYLETTEVVVYMTAEEFHALTPPEGIRVVADLTSFPDDIGTSDDMKSSDEAIVYVYYTHSYTHSLPIADEPQVYADETEMLTKKCEEYYSLETPAACASDGASGATLEYLGKILHNSYGPEFTVVPELCRIQLRLTKDQFKWLEEDFPQYKDGYACRAKIAAE